MKKLKFKQSFEKEYRKMLGKEFDEFFDICKIRLRTSIRTNTLKITVNEIENRFKAKKWKFEKIPWCKNGFFINKRDIPIGNTIEHLLGYYYVQESASMIPPLFLKPQHDEVVLDMCASPGSKTTQICAMMQNKGLVVANEPDLHRMTILQTNLQRCGCKNVVVTRMNGIRFGNLKQKYDKILVDAPCSATGAIRKNFAIPLTWSKQAVNQLSHLQKKLVFSAMKCLRPNGVLVYSTCTLSPEENEEVVDYLINNFDVKIEKIKLHGLKGVKCITEWDNKKYHKDVKNCLRIYPHTNDTEGFFIARVVKNG